MHGGDNGPVTYWLTVGAAPSARRRQRREVSGRPVQSEVVAGALVPRLRGRGYVVLASMLSDEDYADGIDDLEFRPHPHPRRIAILKWNAGGLADSRRVHVRGVGRVGEVGPGPLSI